MSKSETPVRDLSALVVPQVGKLLKTGDEWEPYRMVDASGATVEPVAEYFRDATGPSRPCTRTATGCCDAMVAVPGSG